MSCKSESEHNVIYCNTIDYQELNITVIIHTFKVIIYHDELFIYFLSFLLQTEEPLILDDRLVKQEVDVLIQSFNVILYFYYLNL